MYQYPYGDLQQLNLDWIINKLIQLEQSFVAGESAELEEFANALISLTYIPTQAYNNSDIVFHDGHLYRCNTTIPAPGEVWDPAHWDQIMLGNTVANLVRAVAGMNSDHVFNESNVNGTHVTEALNALVEDIRYDNHKIQQKKNGAYTDVIPVEDTPSNNSDRLASSKAAYDLKGAITSVEDDLASIHATGATNATGSQIDKGTFFYLNGTLVLAKTDIATSAQFTSGTNYEVVTAGALNTKKPTIKTWFGADSTNQYLYSGFYFRYNDYCAGFSLNGLKNVPVGGFTKLFTIPVKARPENDVTFDTMDFQGKHWRFNAGSNGDFGIYNYDSSVVTSQNLVVNFLWIL